MTAPQRIDLTNVSTNEAIVLIVPPEGNPSIEKYQASIKHGEALQACSVNVGAHPLGCTISSLIAATEYTVQVQSCLVNDALCSSFTEQGFWTKPKGIKPLSHGLG